MFCNDEPDQVLLYYNIYIVLFLYFQHLDRLANNIDCDEYDAKFGKNLPEEIPDEF